MKYPTWDAKTMTRDVKTGEEKPLVTYLQEGLVWQAEEIFRNGKWERFYGFVGPHEVCCVPANEIELLKEK
jgi:hypothetical protein